MTGRGQDGGSSEDGTDRPAEPSDRGERVPWRAGAVAACLLLAGYWPVRFDQWGGDDRAGVTYIAVAHDPPAFTLTWFDWVVMYLWVMAPAVVIVMLVGAAVVFGAVALRGASAGLVRVTLVVSAILIPASAFGLISAHWSLASGSVSWGMLALFTGPVAGLLLARRLRARSVRTTPGTSPPDVAPQP